MARNALNKDLFREIKNTRARFLSIFLLVALAVAFLSGLRTTEPDMTKSADDYLDSTNLMDVRLVSTLGLTDSDLEALCTLDGIAEIQGDWQVDALVSNGESSLVVKTIALHAEGINRPYLLEGRLPQAEDECIVEQSLLDDLGKSIGDTLTFDTGTGDYADALTRTTFTVVGTCNSPLYISTQRGTTSLGTGSISAIVYLPESAYALDYYTDIYLTLEGALALNSYSNAYSSLVEAFTDSIADFALERAALRTEEIRSQAQDTLDEAQEEYDRAKAEAEEQLNDAAGQLTDARSELDDGWTAYYEGLDTLEAQADEGQTQLNEAAEQLAEAYTTLTDGEDSYKNGLTQLETGQAEYASGLADYQTALAEYEDGYAQYLDGVTAYEAGLAAYEAALAEYQTGVAQYQLAEEEYSAGLLQYEAGVAAYEAGYAQYEAALAEYQQGYAQYQAGVTAYEAALAQWEAAWAQLVAAGMEESEAGQTLLAQKDILTATAATLSATAEELSSAKATLDATAEQLSATLATLVATESELAAGKTLLDATAEQLLAAEAELTQAAATLSATEALLEDTALTLSDGKSQLSAARTTLEEAAATLAESQTTLTAARTELDSGWQEYYDGLTSLAQGQEELDTALTEAEAELAEALAELQDGEAAYADGLQDYAEAKAEAEAELADAQKQLDEGQEEIDSLSDCTWYVLDRSSNLGFAGFKSDSENMANLAAIFPLIFFLVAALVCLTTMTRMVEEQRITIGGLKALGYSKFAIARKYVGYGLIASVGGSILGLLVGCTVIPWIIITCWQIMYSIPEVKFAFCPMLYLFSASAAVLLIVGTVLSATLSTLRATPAVLMRQKTPKAGKRVLLERITPLWSRLSFNRKVTMRNLFRYKKRFWMTIIGISGCTALIVTGFGLRDSIDNVLKIQYDQLNLYNATAVLEEEDETALSALLESNELVSGYTILHRGTMDFESTTTISGYYLVFDDADSIQDFMVFRYRLTGEGVTLTDDGVYIGEKVSELLDLEVGDTITLVGDQRVTATVAGIVENHVYSYIYMTQAYYQQLFGEAAAHNEALISYVEDSEATENAVSAALLDAGAISSISQISAMRSSLNESFRVINYAVLVVIISAAALAFVVLFNLSNINITERKRELATLKVLGFNDREMSDYVLRENVILTILGILLGLFMGYGLHAFLVRTVEVEMVMFARKAMPTSYLLAALLTALFAVIVNIIAGHALQKIDMVESLKSVE